MQNYSGGKDHPSEKILEMSEGEDDNEDNQINTGQNDEKIETDVQEQCRRSTQTRKSVIRNGEYLHAERTD